MVDFSTSTEELALLKGIREAASQLPTHGMHAAPSRAGWGQLGEMGLLGGCIPEEYGGAGWSAQGTALAYEAAGETSPNLGLVFGGAAHLLACVTPVLHHGSEQLRSELLPGMSAGRVIGANAITEAGAGSDVGALQTTATRVDGGYVLNGVKSFVSNAPIADVFVTYAVTDANAGSLGRTAFVVPRESFGTSVGPVFVKSGLEGCAAAEVQFDDSFVPDSHVLGVPGMGGRIFQQSMLWERTCLFGIYIGLQQKILNHTVGHVRNRRQFGQRLSGFQAVKHQIADMKIRLEGARLLLYRASWGIDHDDDAELFSSLSKLAVSESAVASAGMASQLFGGLGYMRDAEVERALRDASASTVFSGTSNIQRDLVAAGLGL
ncbi:acyl-CoA dehydrogenase family protein [Pseudoclavibacter sp. VKM Ac-2867]|uniref:acyl-CoA dehydrogenase family protein n=1 Tax=Pseudoclavibacter sp. VKM Ac-2867 TaxID=2783829 RepID=UPI00188B89E7|nr:acyl-CoA dehydrogenase family protein [Pseudoclavibacter sp. VKM Ac-2867]MBF4459521.1 acyl-CoA dehydrogenase family protein [Pseudoclavibacter sp. VKM Ac-2867]